ncbi:MAG: bifunctional diaminohydroxyphosphoribosylaminopyrimidine deaminase/5-amino-6-(5-phosphoribosylamino)uracil reductase RibD [Flavobacteriales bacterium]|nr:bifunctional diaminohydroxyphosphoribosylaminopyrimidine deaminase/5-amino-6-(5-phosphoribosylamino)uracil reductase RibD [Flavobacteriales bacterium]
MGNEYFMRRCLELAALSNGEEYPNPKVGAVLVHKGRIVAEGYHRKYGEAHAEVNAIRSLKETGLLTVSTLFVNLEPCNHTGKTPPCTDLILTSGIKKVVIGSKDPNPLVGGKGIEKLRSAGVEVISGVLEEECNEFNQLFFDYISSQNNSVRFTVKWAESADGFIGKPTYSEVKERKLSNSISDRFVHKIRSQHKGILIGVNTVLSDDPQLNNRFWTGDQPVKIILDPDCKTPLSSKLFSDNARVILFNQLKQEKVDSIYWVKIDFFQSLSAVWNSICAELLKEGIYSVLIEGGKKTIESFYHSGIKADYIILKTPALLKNGIPAPNLPIEFYDQIALGNNLVRFGR